MDNQKRLLNQAEQKSADLNSLFMELVNHPTNPITNEDLIKLIKRRPEAYSRFAGFVGKLQ